jgi:hypothetical protein
MEYFFLLDLLDEIYMVNYLARRGEVIIDVLGADLASVARSWNLGHALELEHDQNAQWMVKRTSVSP